MSYHEITVVITSFRSETKIIDCLNSINPEVKVLIIENSNNKDFKKDVEKKYPNTQCFLSNENLGYAKGNNFGLSKVKSKYALIINPDAILEKDAIDNFLLSAKRNKDFAIIGPYVQKDDYPEGNNKKEQKLKNVSSVKGFAMFFNMSQFEKIGFFDEKFFIYLEEIDLCRRVKNINKNIILDPSIKIKHAGGTSHDDKIDHEMELSRNWHWMWSTFYYNKKYNGYFIALIKVLPKLISSIFKMLFYSIIFNKIKKKIYFQRFSGLINSILGKKSWYRPKVF
ncbi:glycosyltransferase family 2 protein [Pelagibacteraceae bacterium]|nr:glycosyltransferase family 2 protein [Pelagibacteraceae bacterium]